MKNISATNIDQIPEPFRGFLAQSQQEPKGVKDIEIMSFESNEAPDQSHYSDLVFLAAILMLCED